MLCNQLSYPDLLSCVVVGVDPLGHAPVLHGDALQEVVVDVEADAQREERELLGHHSLHVLLNLTELDLSCREPMLDQNLLPEVYGSSVPVVSYLQWGLRQTPG